MKNILGLDKDQQGDNLYVTIEDSSVQSNDRLGELAFELLLKYKENDRNEIVGNKSFKILNCKKISEPITYKEATMFSNKDSNLSKKISKKLQKIFDKLNENSEENNEIKKIVKDFLGRNRVIYDYETFKNKVEKAKKIRENFSWFNILGVDFQVAIDYEIPKGKVVAKNKLNPKNGLLSLDSSNDKLEENSVFIGKIKFGHNLGEMPENEFDNLKLSVASSETHDKKTKKALMIENVPITITMKGIEIFNRAKIIVTTDLDYNKRT